MLGRKREGSSSSSRPHTEHAGLAGGTTAVADAGQDQVAVSQFVAQQDEAARERLDRINQRLRLLEQQMEMLEAEVGRATSTDA